MSVAYLKTATRVCLVILCGALAYSFTALAHQYCQRDFYIFWSAAHQFFSGHNPYSIGDYPPEVPGMCVGHYPFATINFPAGLPLLLPLAYFDFDSALFLFLFASLITLCTLPSICRKLVPETISMADQALSIIAILFFPPALLAIYLGQITFFLVPIFIGSLILYTRKSYLLSGILLSLTVIKPHLFYLLYFWILLQAFAGRARRTIFYGLLFGVGTLCALATLIRPTLLREYLYTMTHSFSRDWMVPSIATWIRYFAPSMTLSWIPLIIAGIFAVTFIHRKEKSRQATTPLLDATPLITVMGWSLATTPYVWTYDYTLYIPMLFLFICQPKLSSGRFTLLPTALALLCSAGLTIPKPQQYDFWYPWAMLGLWTLFCRRTGRSDSLS